MSVGAPQPSPPPPATANKAYNNGIYVIQPPPPLLPFLYPNPDDVDDSASSSHSISPLMSAVIAALAAAFLILFYFTVLSRLCRRRPHHRRLNSTSSSPHAADLRADVIIHDPTRPDTGLDDSFIQQIPVFNYKRDDGLVEGTECAVCLTEFEESERLRLMPNCEHAFHIPCIDTWLQSNSSCPLCRSTMNPPPVRTGGGGGGGGGGEVNVAAMQMERGADTMLVVREVEERGEVRVEVVEVETAEECGGNFVIVEEREK